MGIFSVCWDDGTTSKLVAEFLNKSSKVQSYPFRASSSGSLLPGEGESFSFMLILTEI